MNFVGTFIPSLYLTTLSYLLISEQYDASTISVICGKRFGQDGIPRLHIEFVDRFFPLEGIE